MRAFVTGSAGFVGQAVTAALSKGGYDTTGSVRTPIELPWATVVHDWSKPFHPLPIQSAELFVHSAFDPTLVHNEEMARNAAEGALALGARRVILISSGSVFDEQDGAIDSATPLAPLATAANYTRLCQSVETIFRDRLAGVPVVAVRLFYPYGPRESHERLIPRLADSIRQGRPISLRRDSRPRINPVCVDDVGEAVKRLAGLESTSANVNIGGPEVVTIEELARAIGRRLGIEPRFQPADSNYDARDLYCSNEGLRKLTGFAPAIGLEEGLTRMFAP